MEMGGILGMILQYLPFADLLSFAIASQACKSAVRSYLPGALELDTYSSDSLRLLKGLKRWGCLKHLWQVTVTTDNNTCVFKADWITSPSMELLVFQSPDTQHVNKWWPAVVSVRDTNIQFCVRAYSSSK